MNNQSIGHSAIVAAAASIQFNTLHGLNQQGNSQFSHLSMPQIGGVNKETSNKSEVYKNSSNNNS